MTASLTSVIGKSFTNRLSFDYVVDHITLTAVPGPGVDLSRPAILDTPCPMTRARRIARKLGPVQLPLPIQWVPLALSSITVSAGKYLGCLFKGTNAAYGSHGFNIDTGYTPWQQAAPTYTLREDASKRIGVSTHCSSECWSPSHSRTNWGCERSEFWRCPGALVLQHARGGSQPHPSCGALPGNCRIVRRQSILQTYLPTSLGHKSLPTSRTARKTNITTDIN